MFCHRIRISLLVLKFGCGLRVDNISKFSRQILHLGAGVWPAAVYYKQTKEGEGWPEVEVGGERGRVERGNILAQGGAHRGKTHRCRDWNWGCYTDCWVWWELKNSQTWNITVFIRHGTRDNLSFQRFEYLMWIWLCWLWKLPCLLYFECRKANRYQKYKSVELGDQQVFFLSSSLSCCQYFEINPCAAAVAWPWPPWHWINRGAGVRHNHQRLRQVRQLTPLFSHTLHSHHIPSPLSNLT